MLRVDDSVSFNSPILPNGMKETSSSAFATISLWFTFLGEIFACVTVKKKLYSNSTTGGVTFSLRGWCMPGVFLLPAFARLGHECQGLLSLCDGMHVCTD